MTTHPHTTLNGDPSVECPICHAQHGTPSEITLHLRQDHRKYPPKIEASKVAQYFADNGENELALRIFAAEDELIIDYFAKQAAPIPTSAGDLIPGEKLVAITVHVHSYGKPDSTRRYKNVTVGPNTTEGKSLSELRFWEFYVTTE